MNNENNTGIRRGQDQLISFLWIRRSIGLLGFLFPLLLIVGANLFSNCHGVLNSISDYYHTNMRDVFSIVMGLLAFALFTYRGPEKIDGVIANLTGVCALLIVLFSTSVNSETAACAACNTVTYNTAHLIFAVVFFLLLSYFSLFLFTKTAKDCQPTAEKLMRNRVYRICGIVMILSLICIAIYMLFLNDTGTWARIPVVLICEWIALWAFGISWIVKGDWFIMIDKQ